MWNCKNRGSKNKRTNEDARKTTLNNARLFVHLPSCYFFKKTWCFLCYPTKFKSKINWQSASWQSPNLILRHISVYLQHISYVVLI